MLQCEKGGPRDTYDVDSRQDRRALVVASRIQARRQGSRADRTRRRQQESQSMPLPGYVTRHGVRGIEQKPGTGRREEALAHQEDEPSNLVTSERSRSRRLIACSDGTWNNKR